MLFLSGYIISGKAGWKGFTVVIAVYFSINYLINLIGHTNWGRRLIIGTPTILIDKGKINRRNLQKMNMNMTDFFITAPNQGYSFAAGCFFGSD